MLTQQLYALVGELESLFPGRKFTPDGHLVGSLGEVIATHDYDLILLGPSSKTHDAMKGIQQVQIKATQGRSVALYGEPEHLLVLRLLKNGSAEEVYNGPGALAWAASGKVQKNGQRPISVTKLKQLMAQVQEHQRIPRTGQVDEAKPLCTGAQHPMTTRTHGNPGKFEPWDVDEQLRSIKRIEQSLKSPSIQCVTNIAVIALEFLRKVAQQKGIRMEDIDTNMIIDDFAEAERKGNNFPNFSGGLT